MTITGTPLGSSGLCTLSQVKAQGEIKRASDDALITDLIATLNPTICERYGREFMPRVTEARTFDIKRLRVDLVDCDLVSATSVTLHPEEGAIALVAGTDYMLGGLDRRTKTYSKLLLMADTDLRSKLSDNFGFAHVTINGTWGCFADTSSVLPDINRAAIETVLSWLDKPVADITAIDTGDPTRRQPNVPSAWDIPTSAHRKLYPFSRNLGVY